MSVEFEAHAIIGIRLEREWLWKAAEVRGCGHPMPDVEGALFCTQCGKRLWEPRRVPLEAFNEERCKLAGLEFLTGHTERYIYLGKRITAEQDDDGEAFMTLAPIDVIARREDLQKRLEPLGLWDGAKFGLWAVLTAG